MRSPRNRVVASRPDKTRHLSGSLLLLAMATQACGVDPLAFGPSSPSEPRAIAKAREQGALQAQALATTTAARLVVHPSRATLVPGQSVQPIAVGIDSSGNALPGVRVTWSAKDSSGKSVAVEAGGRFTGSGAGNYLLTATDSAGNTASMPVTVQASSVTSSMARPIAEVATQTTNVGDPGYDPSIGQAVFRPINQRRPRYNTPLPRLPRSGGIEVPSNAGVGDFTFSVPLIAGPGRGLDTNLSLYYSAKVWTVTDTAAVYDADGDWPAPGFTVSLGKLIVSPSDVIFIDPSGARHHLVTFPWVQGTQTYLHVLGSGTASDGSLIRITNLVWNGNSAVSATVWYPDGTRLDFGAPGGEALYVTRMTDSNGNYLTASYWNNQGPKLETLQDTVNRSYSFNYDGPGGNGSGNLISITGPGLANALGESTTRTYVKLHYSPLTISANFDTVNVFTDGVTINPTSSGGTRQVLDAVVFSDGTGYSMLAGGAGYVPLGLIATYEEHVGMGIDASGNVTQGQMRKSVTYSWPPATLKLTTAPLYGQSTQGWLVPGATGPQSGVTKYATSTDATNVTITTTVTAPDGSMTSVVSDNNSNNISYGLPLSTTSTDPTGKLILRKTTYAYTTVVPSAAAVSEQRVSDYYPDGASSVTRRTVYSYPASPTAQLGSVDEYDFDMVTLLRRTAYTYIPATNYSGNHILNLVASVSIYDGSLNVQAETDYTYDGQLGQALVNPASGSTVRPVNHDVSYDPYSTSYNSTTDYRGNVSTVKRYLHPAQGSAGGVLVTSKTYDILGNAVGVVSEGGVQTANSFPATYGYAYMSQSTSGAAPTTISTSALYDFGTGLVTQTTAPSGATTNYSFGGDSLHPDSLRLHSVVAPTGAHQDLSYDDPNLAVTAITYGQGGTSSTTIVAKSIVQQNGLGLPIHTTDSIDSATADVIDDNYDSMGRLSGESLPHRVGAAASFAQFAYDYLSRETTKTAPDGSTSTVQYQPALKTGQPGIGITTIETNAWGAQRWSRYDALGQLAASFEGKSSNPPFPTLSFGSSGILSTYSYDLLGNLLSASSAGKTHTFAYDGVSHLVGQHLVERNATLSPAGAYVGAAQGSYSDVFIYDSAGRLAQSVDARGVVTTFGYGSDPLGRLQTVSYNVGGVGDVHKVQPADSVEYHYCTPLLGLPNTCPHADVTLVAYERTLGPSNGPETTRKTSRYDSFGRLVSLETAVAGLPVKTAYTLDALGRPTQVSYPALNGQAQKTLAVVLDWKGRPTNLRVGVGTALNPFAQNVLYDATGGMAQADIGFGTYQARETWTWEPNSGYLQRQTVVPQGGSSTLDLQYNYALASGAANARTGRLTGITNNKDQTRNRHYGYDSLGRLVTVSNGASATWSQAYSYDDSGNRLQVQVSGSVPTDGLAALQQYTAQNRISGFDYDDAGNLVQGAVDGSTTQIFQYDAAGRLYSVSTPTTSGGTTTTTAAQAPIGYIGSGCTGSPNCKMPDGCAGSRFCDQGAWSDCQLTSNSTRSCTTPCGAPGTQTCPQAGGYGACVATACCPGSGGGCTLSNGCGGTVQCDGSCLPNGAGAQGGQVCQLANGCGGAFDCNANCVASGGTTNAVSCTSTLNYAGHENCTSGGALLGCEPDVAADRYEVCNGLDDDGDGLVDNAPGSTTAHTLAQSCTTACGTGGIQTCLGVDASNNPSWSACSSSGCPLLLQEQYGYGVGRDRLSMQDASGNRTYFVRSGGAVLAEYTQANGGSAIPSKQYVRLNGRLVAALTPSGGSDTIEWYHSDRLGVRLIATSTTTPPKEQVTLPFGTSLPSESSGSTKYVFTSYERSSSTKLDYGMNRFYSGSLGRFLQPDPIAKSALRTGNSQSHNGYSYVSNDPANFADPSGLWSMWWVITIQWTGYNSLGGQTGQWTTRDVYTQD